MRDEMASAGPEPARESVWGPGDGSALEWLLKPQALSAWAYPKIFDRGLAYAAEGRVVDLELGEWCLSARVIGGGEEAYRVRVDALPGADGEPPSLDGLACDCPWSLGEAGEKGACKHAIAAGIAAGEAYAAAREAAQIESGMAAPGAARKPRSRI